MQTSFYNIESSQEHLGTTKIADGTEDWYPEGRKN